MYQHANVKTSPDFPIPDTMRAWILGDPDQLTLGTKPVPVPKKAEVLVRIDAVAICATDLEIIHHGPPAMIQGVKALRSSGVCESSSADAGIVDRKIRFFRS